MKREKRTPVSMTPPIRAVANTYDTAGAFRPAIQSIQRMTDNPTVRTPSQQAVHAAVHPYQRKAGHDGVVQRKVLINDNPVITLGSGKALLGKQDIKAPGPGESWINDGFARRYNSTDEFEKHAGGEEVSVGLSKRMGRWYRIPHLDPASRKFFVWGELHSGYGYRELIRETNQKGKVLGEGGSNTMMSATSDSVLEKNTDPNALKDDKGNSREYTMENLFSKAYFGLVAFKDSEENKTGRSSRVVSGPQTRTEDGETWLTHYQSLRPDERKKNKHNIPYYEDTVNQEHVYPAYGTPAERYNGKGTGISVLDKLWHQIDKMNPRSSFYAEIWAGLHYFRNNYKGKWNNSAVNMYKSLLTALEEGVNAEAELLKVKDGAKQDKDAPSVVGKIEEKRETKGEPETDDKEKDLDHRDLVMYHSVLKASKDGFIMAGMGDNHAKNLKDRFILEGIPVINFADFVSSPISEDAITPMTEQDSDFSDKERGQEDAKKEYLEALDALRREAEEKEKRTLQTEEQMEDVPVVVTEQVSRSLWKTYGIWIMAGTVIALGILYKFMSKGEPSSS